MHASSRKLSARRGSVTDRWYIVRKEPGKRGRNDISGETGERGTRERSGLGGKSLLLMKLLPLRVPKDHSHTSEVLSCGQAAAENSIDPLVLDVKRIWCWLSCVDAIECHHLFCERLVAGRQTKVPVYTESVEGRKETAAKEERCRFVFGVEESRGQRILETQGMIRNLVYEKAV